MQTQAFFFGKKQQKQKHRCLYKKKTLGLFTKSASTNIMNYAMSGIRKFSLVFYCYYFMRLLTFCYSL